MPDLGIAEGKMIVSVTKASAGQEAETYIDSFHRSTVVSCEQRLYRVPCQLIRYCRCGLDPRTGFASKPRALMAAFTPVSSFIRMLS